MGKSLYLLAFLLIFGLFLTTRKAEALAACPAEGTAFNGDCFCPNPLERWNNQYRKCACNIPNTAFVGAARGGCQCREGYQARALGNGQSDCIVANANADSGYLNFQSDKKALKVATPEKTRPHVNYIPSSQTIISDRRNELNACRRFYESLRQAFNEGTGPDPRHPDFYVEAAEIGTLRATGLWHCRTMESDDAIRAYRRMIAYHQQCVQTRCDDPVTEPLQLADGNCYARAQLGDCIFPIGWGAASWRNGEDGQDLFGVAGRYICIGHYEGDELGRNLNAVLPDVFTTRAQACGLEAQQLE